MPHNGRHYPFLPQYWAGRAWFWPGFVPWKLHGQTVGVLLPPWDAIGSGWSGLSSPGVPSTDRSECYWDFAGAGPPPWSFRITLRRSGLLPALWQAEWEAVMPSTGLPSADAIADQVYPQTTVFLPAFASFVGFPPYNSGIGPNLSFRPASYAEGGSPYP
jgi:hypothetical protein